MHSPRHPFSVALLIAIFGTLLLALPASPALAKQTRLFHGTFGAAGSTTPNPYPLSKPWSIAVDHSKGPSKGDIYVADVGNHRVEKFDPSGHLILMFGKGVNKTAVEEGKPEAQQNVCLAAEACQPGTAGSTPGAFQSKLQTFFLAVDSSSGPSAGDVYVADPSDGNGNGTDLVTKFDEGGHVVSSWGTDGQLDGSGLAEGPFWDLAGVAVDPTGNLWVLGRINGSHEPKAYAQVFEFSQDATPITSWNLTNVNETPTNQEPTFENPDGLSLDSSDHLYFAEGRSFGTSLVAYDSSGGRLGLITNVFFDPESGQHVSGGNHNYAPSAFALDPPTNDVYTAETLPTGGAGPGVIRRYDAASCQPMPDPTIELVPHGCLSTESFGVGRLGNGRTVRGLALDPTSSAHTVYAVKSGTGDVTAFANLNVPDVATVKASALTGTSARLNGTVNPSGEALTQCFFEWAEGEEPYEHVVPCESPDAAGVGSGTSPVEVHAQISGLSAAKTYHFRLVASNANTDLAEEPSQGQDLSFGPPRILGASALGISATAATLEAQLNPNNVATTYRFEYDTLPYAEGEGPHGTATPVTGAGSDGEDLSRSTAIQGLEPTTTYHYRVVAQNELGSAESADGTFTTQGAAASILPDGRAWEQVSPPDKHGTPLLGIGGDEGTLVQAATDGSGITYAARGPIDSEPAGNRSAFNSQILSRRSAAGWATRDVASPHQAPVGILPGSLSEYAFFSADLSLGALEPAGATPLSPQTTEKTPYLLQPDGTYLPLVTAANVPEGVKFGGKDLGFESPGFADALRLETATPDLDHVLLSSPQPLTEDFKPNFKGAGQSIYEWSAGSLQLASWAPPGSSIACGGTDPACVPGAEVGLSSIVGRGESNHRHAISTDGSRVVFTAFGSKGNALYLRDQNLGETLQLDVPEPGAEGSSGSGVFQDANADGSRIFFTDAQRLTLDSTAANNTYDLYMCQIKEEAGQLACDLKDLSVDHNPGESADVLGGIAGTSEDGSSVYFVANGALTEGEGAVHGNCGFPGGTCNLYRYDTETEGTALVTVLSSDDSPDWNRGFYGLTARVSPNGRFLAFMSQRPLTGYDNRDAKSGERDQEVYLYDAEAEGGQGKILCASCNFTGSRPHGAFDKGGYPGPLVDRQGLWAHGSTLAGSIPGWTSVSGSAGALYQSRYLSNSGRLFFNAADALVPQDSNGVEDVYQYEPVGVGDCGESNPTFAKASSGCVNLISSGTSPEESAFLDASENGNDVFFLTASKLASTDVDAALDVYDAHACSATSPCPPPPPPPPPACEGDSCQLPANPPNDPTPGSLSFHGAGNVHEAKAHKKKHAKKKTKKAKSKKSHKRAANHNRRTGR